MDHDQSGQSKFGGLSLRNRLGGGAPPRAVKPGGLSLKAPKTRNKVASLSGALAFTEDESSSEGKRGRSKQKKKSSRSPKDPLSLRNPFNKKSLQRQLSHPTLQNSIIVNTSDESRDSNSDDHEKLQSKLKALTEANQLLLQSRTENELIIENLTMENRQLSQKVESVPQSWGALEELDFHIRCRGTLFNCTLKVTKNTTCCQFMKALSDAWKDSSDQANDQFELFTQDGRSFNTKLWVFGPEKNRKVWTYLGTGTNIEIEQTEEWVYKFSWAPFNGRTKQIMDPDPWKVFSFEMSPYTLLCELNAAFGAKITRGAQERFNEDGMYDFNPQVSKDYGFVFRIELGDDTFISTKDKALQFLTLQELGIDATKIRRVSPARTNTVDDGKREYSINFVGTDYHDVFTVTSDTTNAEFVSMVLEWWTEEEDDRNDCFEIITEDRRKYSSKSLQFGPERHRKVINTLGSGGNIEMVRMEEYAYTFKWAMFSDTEKKLGPAEERNFTFEMSPATLLGELETALASKLMQSTTPRKDEQQVFDGTFDYDPNAVNVGDHTFLIEGDGDHDYVDTRNLGARFCTLSELGITAEKIRRVGKLKRAEPASESMGIKLAAKEAELGDLRAQYDGLLEEYKSRGSQREGELQERDARIEDLEARLATSEEASTALKTEREHLISERDKLYDTLAALERDNEMLLNTAAGGAKLEEKERIEKALRKELQQRVEDVTSLSTKLDAANAELLEKFHEIEQLRKDSSIAENISAKFLQLKEQIEVLKNENENLEEQNLGFNELLGEKDELIGELRSLNKRTAQEKERSLARLEQQNGQSRDEMTGLLAELEDKNDQILALTTKVNQLQSEVENYKDAMNMKMDELAGVMEEKDALLGEKMTDLSEMGEKFSTLQNQLGLLNEQLQIKDAELKKSRGNSSLAKELDMQLTDKELEIERLKNLVKAERDRIDEQEEEAESKLQQKSQKIVQLGQLITNQESKLDELRHDLGELGEQLAEREGELEKVRELADSREKEVEKLRAHVEENEKLMDAMQEKAGSNEALTVAQQEIIRLTDLVSEKNDLVNNLETSLADALVAHSSCDEEKHALQMMSQKALQDTETLSLRLEESLAQAQEAISQANTERDTIVNELRLSEEKREKLLVMIENQQSSQGGDSEQLEAQIAEKDTSIKEKNKEIKMLEATLEHLRAELEQANASLLTADNAATQKSVDFDLVESEAKEHLQKIEQLEQTEKNLIEDLTNTQLLVEERDSKILRMQSLSSQQENTIGLLEEKVEELMAELEEKQADLDTMINEEKKLREEIDQLYQETTRESEPTGEPTWEQVQDLKDRLLFLETELKTEAELQAELEDARQTIETQRITIDGLEKKIGDRHEREKVLQDQISELSGKIAQLMSSTETGMGELVERNEELELELRDKDEALAGLREALASGEGGSEIVDELRGDLQEKQEQLLENQEVIAGQKEQIERLGKALKENTDLIQNLESTLENLDNTGTLDALNLKMEQKDLEIQMLQDALKDTSTENELKRLHGVVATLESEKEAAEAKVAELEGSMQDLEGDTKAAKLNEFQIKELKVKVETLKADLAASRAGGEELQDKLEEANTKLRTLELQLQELPAKDRRITELQSELALQESAMSLLEAKLKQADTHGSSIQEFKHKVLELEGTIERKNAQLDTLERLQNENRSLLQENDSLQNQLMTKNHELRRINLAQDTMSVGSEGDDSSVGRYKQVQQLSAMMTRQEEEHLEELKTKTDKFKLRITRMDEEIEHLTNKLMAKTQQIRKTEVQMFDEKAASKLQIDSLTEQNILLSATRDNAMEQLKEMRLITANMETQLRNDKAEANEKEQGLTRQLHDRRTRIAELEQEVERVKAEVEDYRLREEEYELSIERHRKSVHLKREEIDNLLRDKSATEARARDAEAQLQQVKSSLELKNDEISRKESEIGHLLEMRSILEKNVEAKGHRELEYEEELSRTRKSIERQKRELEELMSARTILESQVEEREKNEKQLLGKIRQLSSSRTDLSKELDSKLDSITQLQTLFEQQELMLEEVKYELDQKTTAFGEQKDTMAQSLGAKIEQLQDLELTLEQRVSQFQEENRKLVEEKQAVEHSLFELRQRNEQVAAKMQSGFEEYENKVQKLEKELTKTNAELSRKTKRLNELDLTLKTKADEFDDNKLQRVLRMKELKLTESQMDLERTKDDLEQLDMKTKNRIKILDAEVESLRMAVGEMNKEKANLLARLKSPTSQDLAHAQEEFEKLTKQQAEYIEKLRQDYDRRSAALEETLDHETVKLTAARNKIKQDFEAQVYTLKKENEVLLKQHRDEVRLLKESHAKQLEVARQMPRAASRGPQLDFNPSELNLAGELQNKLKNLQTKFELSDQAWRTKMEKVESDWQDRYDLLRQKQVGLTDLQRNAYEEKISFMEAKVEKAEMMKRAAEGEQDRLEHVVKEQSGRSQRLVNEVTELHTSMLNLQRTHADQLELLGKSGTENVNQRLLNLVTSSMDMEHKKEDRLMHLNKTLQENERNLEAQLKEQKAYYQSELAGVRQLGQKEVEITVQKYTTQIAELNKDIDRLEKTIKDQRTYRKSLEGQAQETLEAERTELKNRAILEVQHMKTVHAKEMMEVSAQVDDLRNHLQEERHGREEAELLLKQEMTKRKAEIEMQHTEEVKALQRVGNLRDEKYANAMQKLQEEHEIKTKELTLRHTTREEEHAIHVKSMQQKHRDTVSEFQNDIAGLNAKIANLEQVVQDQKQLYEGSNDELRLKLNKMNKEVVELETYVIKCRDLEEQLVEYKQAAEYLEQSVSSLQNQVEEQQNDHNLLLSKSKMDARHQLEEVQDQLQRKSKELDSLKTEYDDLYQKHHEIQTAHVRVLKDYKMAKENYGCDMDELKDVQKEVVDQLHQDRAQLQWSLQELKHQLENAEQLKQQSLRDLQKRHEQKQQQLEWDIKDLKYQLTQAGKATDLEVDRTQAKMEKRMQQKEFELQTLRGQLDQANDQLHIEVAKERNRIKIKLDTATSHIEQLNKERETLTADFQNRITELRLENEELRKFQAHHAADSYRTEDLRYQVKQLETKRDHDMLEIQVWQAECMQKQEKLVGLEKERDQLKRELTVFKQEVFSNKPIDFSRSGYLPGGPDLVKIQNDVEMKQGMIDKQHKQLQEAQMEINLLKYQLESKQPTDMNIQEKLQVETIMDLTKEVDNLKKKGKRREHELVNKYRESQETVKRLDDALRNALTKHGELNKTVLKLRPLIVPSVPPAPDSLDVADEEAAGGQFRYVRPRDVVTLRREAGVVDMLLGTPKKKRGRGKRSALQSIGVETEDEGEPEKRTGGKKSPPLSAQAEELNRVGIHGLAGDRGGPENVSVADEDTEVGV